jgi:MFS family permease
MFLTIAAIGFLEPFVPLYLELSGLKRGQIGLVTGIGASLALLIQPFLGRLSDRLDARRPLMFAAAVLAGCAYLSYTRTSSLIPFVLLTGMGINGIMYLNTGSAALVGRLASSQGNSPQGGGLYASYRVWGSIGYVVVSLLAGWLLSQRLGTQGTMSREAIAPLFVYGPLLFFLIAGVVFLLPDPKKHELVSSPSSYSDLNDEDSPEQRVSALNLRRFLTAYFLYFFAYTGSAAYLSLHLKSLGATPMWITGVFATGVLCEAIIMSQAGRLSDRFGRRPLLALAFAFMPMRLLLYVPATGPLWVLCVQTIHGINFGIMVAVAVAFVNDLCTEHNRGAAQAKLVGTAGFASAFGPAVGGWIAQQFGIPWTFAVMSCVAAAGASVFLWRVRESHTQAKRLYHYGPACLRPVFGVLCVPMAWLSRRPKLRREAD